MSLQRFIYSDGMTLYHGPLDFYWQTYNPLLMLLLIFLTFTFGARYRATKKRSHARATNAFGYAGLVVLALIMIIDTLRSDMVAPAVITVTVVSLFAWVQHKLS